MERFGERLREARKSIDLTQKKLANILQTTNSSVCDWECGRTQPDLETLVALADFFDVTTDFLLGREDEVGERIPKK